MGSASAVKHHQVTSSRSAHSQKCIIMSREDHPNAQTASAHVQLRVLRTFFSFFLHFFSILRTNSPHPAAAPHTCFPSSCWVSRNPPPAEMGCSLCPTRQWCCAAADELSPSEFRWARSRAARRRERNLAHLRDTSALPQLTWTPWAEARAAPPPPPP